MSGVEIHQSQCAPAFYESVMQYCDLFDSTFFPAKNRTLQEAVQL
jgi:hypothetical protein